MAANNHNLAEAIECERLAHDYRNTAAECLQKGQLYNAAHCATIAALYEKKALEAHLSAIEIVPDRRMTMVA